jgi:hypothetical protein
MNFVPESPRAIESILLRSDEGELFSHLGVDGKASIMWGLQLLGQLSTKAPTLKHANSRFTHPPQNHG